MNFQWAFERSKFKYFIKRRKTSEKAWIYEELRLILNKSFDKINIL